MEKYIRPFIKTCEAVFKGFCNTEIVPGRVSFIERDEFEKIWDISGIIGLSGEIKGAVAISMKDITAFRITEILTKVEHKFLDSDVTDAVGEIINIIAGNTKKDIEETLGIKISIPTVIRGKAHSIVWPSEKTRIICISFCIFSDQEICLSIAVDPAK